MTVNQNPYIIFLHNVHDSCNIKAPNNTRLTLRNFLLSLRRESLHPQQTPAPHHLEYDYENQRQRRIYDSEQRHLLTGDSDGE